MMNSLLELWGLLTVVCFCVLVWHFSGVAARNTGTSRLAVIGAIFLLGNLLG